MFAYIQTAKLAAMEKFQGGVLNLLIGYALRALALVPLMFLWRSFAEQGADLGGLSLAQLLSYTYAGALLEPLLNIQSPASHWHYEGTIIDLYKRPMGVFGQLISQTAGGWAPVLALYTLPMLLLSPLLGVSVIPKTPWFFLSLMFTVSLGFALDFLYACLIIRLQNIVWLGMAIRSAVMALFSGAVIPFGLLPWGIGEVFKALPFGSLAGAPLSLLTGMSDALNVIPLQIVWNLLLWPLAGFVFAKSRERMVSYGG